MIVVPPSFCGFDPQKPVEINIRNLPHWRQLGATYAVTFRLADALPEGVRNEISGEILRFREQKAKGVPVSPGSPMWLRYQDRVSKRVNEVLDETHGEAWLKAPEIAAEVQAVIEARDSTDYELFAYVIMPNHCHFVVRPIGEFALEKSIQAWKSISARRINKRLGLTGKLWQSEYYDHIVRDDADYRRVVQYVLDNPAKSGLGEGGATVWQRSESQA